MLPIRTDVRTFDEVRQALNSIVSVIEAQVEAVTINHSEVGDDEPERHIDGTDAAVAALNVDWSAGSIFTKTLSAGANTFTFSNQVQGHTIIMKLTPVVGSLLTMPTGCVTLSGTFTDAEVNYVHATCIDDTTPEYLISISQGA